MNAEVERRVQGFVADLRRSRLEPDVLAVILAGSAARGEERWDGAALVSDIDLMIVSRSSTLRVDRSRAVRRLLTAHAGGNIDGGRIPAATLDYATLTNFEARHHGIVVAGDRSVLERIPLGDSADIPRWEAVRLLANRLFEHLKVRAGASSGEAAAIKSYEAIGEAQLVLEGRYRPSFRARADEMRRRPLGSPVEAAAELYVAAEEIRRGERERLPATPGQALDDLRLQLGWALGTSGYEGATLGAQLTALGREQLHLRQRVYWTLRGLGRRDGLHRPDLDPVIQVWRAGARALAGEVSAYDARALVGLWQQCPQILEKKERQ